MANRARHGVAAARWVYSGVPSEATGQQPLHQAGADWTTTKARRAIARTGRAFALQQLMVPVGDSSKGEFSSVSCNWLAQLAARRSFDRVHSLVVAVSARSRHGLAY